MSDQVGALRRSAARWLRQRGLTLHMDNINKAMGRRGTIEAIMALLKDVGGPPKNPSEAAIDEFMRVYYPPVALEAMRTDVLDSGVTRLQLVRNSVSVALQAAYTAESL